MIRNPAENRAQIYAYDELSASTVTSLIIRSFGCSGTPSMHICSYGGHHIKDLLRIIANRSLGREHRKTKAFATASFSSIKPTSPARHLHYLLC